MSGLEIPIAEAKARFAECIRQAERGRTIVLTRHGRPVARLCGLAEIPPGELREPRESYRARRPPPLDPESRRQALERVLEEEIWPHIPEELLGRGIGKSEREKILGYGEEGV